jgi:hypothetical protein
MFAGCCHYWEMFWYFLPGMVLYGVDGVYRIHQGLGFWGSSSSSSSSGCVEVLEAVASPGQTTCSLLLSAPRCVWRGAGVRGVCVGGGGIEGVLGALGRLLRDKA